MAIHFDDYVIYSSISDILNVLKAQLYERNVIRFAIIKQTGENVMTNCPFHADGLEKKPSFGISEKGECHCFACGYATSYFPEFISNVMGIYDKGTYGKEWLLSQMALHDNTHHNKFTFDFLDKPRNVEDTIVSEEELDSYRYIHPYMYKRHLSDEIINQFDVGYDKDRQCITFPVKNLKGDVIFVATRSVNSKFFSLPAISEKPIYAAHLFTSGKYAKAIICESIFNALTCWKLGLPAMALLGTGSYSQIKILSQLPVAEYYLALDPDKAGNLGCQRIYNALKGKHLLYRYTLPEGKDVNDLDVEFLKLKPRLYFGT